MSSAVARRSPTDRPSSPLLTLIDFTIREHTRRRTVFGLVVLMAAVLVVSIFGLDRFAAAAVDYPPALVRVGVAQILVPMVFLQGFILATAAITLAASALAADVESGQILAVLARPVSRTTIVAGRLIGLGVLLVPLAFAVSVIDLVAAYLRTGYTPPNGVAFVASFLAELVAVLSFALLCSATMAPVAAGVTGFVAFGAAWILGFIGAAGAALGNLALVHAATASRLILPSDGLWRHAAYALEPPVGVIAAAGREGAAFIANPFFVGDPQPLAFLAWSVAWLGVVVAATVVTFARRSL